MRTLIEEWISPKDPRKRLQRDRLKALVLGLAAVPGGFWAMKAGVLFIFNRPGKWGLAAFGLWILACLVFSIFGVLMFWMVAFPDHFPPEFLKPKLRTDDASVRWVDTRIFSLVDAAFNWLMLTVGGAFILSPISDARRSVLHATLMGVILVAFGLVGTVNSIFHRERVEVAPGCLKSHLRLFPGVVLRRTVTDAVAVELEWEDEVLQRDHFLKVHGNVDVTLTVFGRSRPAATPGGGQFVYLYLPAFKNASYRETMSFLSPLLDRPKTEVE